MLSVRDLTVSFGITTVVDSISFDIAPGECVGLVGESGSGKSVTAYALTRLVEHSAAQIKESSSINLAGQEVTRLPAPELRKLRAARVGMVYQDPLSSLNPVQRVSTQIGAALRAAEGDLAADEMERRVVRALHEVGIADPERRQHSFPHEFSGGMRQRVMIAMALVKKPQLLILDEPTTALDVTIQAQILDLLRDLTKVHGVSALLISHDLSIMQGLADRVLVMYAGRIVETGTTEQVLTTPRHPYTAGLLASLPSIGGPKHHRFSTIGGSPPRPSDRPTGCAFHPRCRLADTSTCVDVLPPLRPVAGTGHDAACHYAEAVTIPQPEIGFERPAVASDRQVKLAATNMTKRYPTGRPKGLLGRRDEFAAVDDVTIEVFDGECLGIVGESGSGKSTLARCLARLIDPTDGSVQFEDRDVTMTKRSRLRAFRRSVQVVFQDPSASLDPRWKIGRQIAEPMRVHGLWGNEGFDDNAVTRLLESVGLSAEDRNRYPREFSGGQRQRIAIARALALRPDVLVCDEPISSLDVSVQAQILNLLSDLRDELGLTYVFIAHDLAVVRNFCDRVAVMHDGQIVEIGPTDEVFAAPQHEYTKNLLEVHPGPKHLDQIPVHRGPRDANAVNAAIASNRKE